MGRGTPASAHRHNLRTVRAPPPFHLPICGQGRGVGGSGQRCMRRGHRPRGHLWALTGWPARGLHLAAQCPEAQHRRHSGGPTEEREHRTPGTQLHRQQQVRPRRCWARPHPPRALRATLSRVWPDQGALELASERMAGALCPRAKGGGCKVVSGARGAQVACARAVGHHKAARRFLSFEARLPRPGSDEHATSGHSCALSAESLSLSGLQWLPQPRPLGCGRRKHIQGTAKTAGSGERPAGYASAGRPGGR